MMITDTVDDNQGRFNIWGNTREGETVLVRVHDFQPYFYFVGPVQQVQHKYRCSTGVTQLLPLQVTYAPTWFLPLHTAKLA